MNIREERYVSKIHTSKRTERQNIRQQDQISPRQPNHYLSRIQFLIL